MKPKRIINCSHYHLGLCIRFGYTIDDCKPKDCEVADFVYEFIYPDPDFEPFIDELNRRLDKGV